MQLPQLACDLTEGFFLCARPAAGRSELDELQEEVARRARQQEQQKRREAEREAAMGFNPKPSKFMDLDQLQHQGMRERVGKRKTRTCSKGGCRKLKVFKECQTKNTLSHLALVLFSHTDSFGF